MIIGASLSEPHTGHVNETRLYRRYNCMCTINSLKVCEIKPFCVVFPLKNQITLNR